MTAQTGKQKELTGRHVLLMVVGFFVVIIAVNAYFITAAVTSFSGEDVKGSYRQGLEYNETIAARNIQNTLGWKVSANILEDFTGDANGPKYIIILAKDKDGRVLEGLSFNSVLRHPTDLKQDRAFTLRPLGNGKYKASLEGLSGSWQLRATADDGKNSFRFEHSFTLP